MNKKLNLLALSLLTVTVMRAQNYDFNTYKYRFQKFRGFDTYFNLTGNGTSFTTNTKGYFNNDLRNERSFNAPRMDSRLNFNGSYFQSMNLDRLQQDLSFSLYGHYNQNSNQEEDESDNYNLGGTYSRYIKKVDNNRSAQLTFNFNMTNRYYRQDNRFKLLGINTSVSYGGNAYRALVNDTANTAYNINKVKSNSYNLNIGINLGLGKGRMEYVSDPIMTQFLLLDLQRKAGIGDVSSTQLEAIVKGMTQIRNTRFIDFRFRLIDQLEMLDSVLKANGIHSDKASRYFTTINDNWLYATRMQRVSGKRWTYFVQLNNLAYQVLSDWMPDFQMTYRHDTRNQLLDGSANIEFVKSRQKSLEVQTSYGANLSIGGRNRMFNSKSREFQDGEMKSKAESKHETFHLVSSLGAYYEYLYQPNSRTYFTLSVNPSVSASSLTYTNVYDWDREPMDNTLNGSLSLSVAYFRFISARLSYSVHVSSLSALTSNKNSSLYSPATEDRETYTTNQYSNGLNFRVGLNYLLF